MNKKQDEYADMLMKLRARGYTFLSFPEGKAWPTDQGVIMRHDIDLSMEAAESMAEIEASLGIQSTYFFMVSSPLYNIHSLESIRAMEAIARNHRTGLHFDCSVYPTLDAASLDYWVQQEASVLTTGVEAVSFHKPGQFELAKAQLNCAPHTYEPVFTGQKFRYLADSGGRWDQGHPLESPQFEKKQNLHILVHPVWHWFDEGPREILQRLRNMKAQATEDKFGEDMPRVWGSNPG